MLRNQIYIAHISNNSTKHELKSLHFIPRHTMVAGYWGFTLDVVCRSVHPSFVRPSVRPYFVSGWKRVDIDGFSPGLVYALVLLGSGLGLLVGGFRRCLAKLSARDTMMAFLLSCKLHCKNECVFCNAACHNPVSILHKSKAGRYRPVRVADGPITARCRFMKNASWEVPYTSTKLE